MRQKMSAAKSIVNKQGSFSSGVLRRLACFLYLLDPVTSEGFIIHIFCPYLKSVKIVDPNGSGQKLALQSYKI